MIARPRPGPWVGVALLVVAMATWMSAGRLHTNQTADSIVPVLVSLQRWTPFFWGQDRFGMLIPLVAMPFRHPLANMIAQGWMLCAAGLLAPFLVARWLDAAPLTWFTAGAFANVLLLLMARPEVQFDWLVGQPYSLSITLAAAGLLAAERDGPAGTAASLALMLLAHWVNLTIFVLIVPLILLRRPFVARALATTACGIAVGLALTRLSPDRTPSAVIPLSEWPQAWVDLWARASTAFPHPGGVAAIIVLAAAGTALLVARSDGRRHVEAAAVALLVGLIYWLAAGTSRWVQLNLFYPRYIFSSVLMSGVAAGIVFAALLRNRSGLLAALTAAALLVVTAIGYGPPSPRGVRSTIDRRLGAITTDVVSSGATVIGGDYWVVWPAVFHANLTTYRRSDGSRHAFYGLTYRSEPTNRFWMNGSRDVLIAAPAGDQSIERWVNRIGLTIAGVERRGALDLFLVRPRA